MFYLSLAIVLNLSQVVCILLHAPLQVWGFCVCIQTDLTDQEVCLVSQPGAFTDIGSKQLAHVSKMFLHIGDVFLDLSCLAVPGVRGT